jgi:hypothetical protein
MKNELQKAWVAGFIDGEGCLTISKQIRKDRPSDAWRPMVTVANTNYESLNILKSIYGGTLRFNTEKRCNIKTGVKWSDSWSWYCPQSKVVEFCTDLLPYLIIKKRNAEILIEFMNHLQTTKREKGGRKKDGTFKGSSPLSEDHLKFREDLRNQIQNLNSRKRYV